jgi:hypothetical protein
MRIPAALPMSKRDLAKIGIATLEQLEQPLPAGILIKGKLAVRADDDGNENNRLVRFDFACVEKGDTFEPKDDDAATADTSFNFGANAAPSANGAHNPEGATP